MSALSVAVETRDAERLELALNDLSRAGLASDLTPILVDVLVMDWHERHEDVARALQVLRDPRAIDALFSTATATYPFFRHDEFFGLARKCIWALADIGTPEARERLRELERSDNRTIAGYARRRLERWDAERGRKRPIGAT